VGHFKKFAVPAAPCYPAVGEPRLAPRQELVDVWRPPRRHHGVRHNLYTATSPRNSWAYECLTPLIPPLSLSQIPWTGWGEKKKMAPSCSATHAGSAADERSAKGSAGDERSATHADMSSLDHFPRPAPLVGRFELGLCARPGLAIDSIEGGGKRLSWP
jgi:hypothetical protein